MTKQESDRRLSINLVGWDNGGGLSTDIGILAQILMKSGCRLGFNGHEVRKPRTLSERLIRAAASRLRRGFASFFGNQTYDVNLFLESICPEFVPFARLNCFFPNPEWFREENMLYLSQMDTVLCKTWNAVETFKPLAADTRYVGFTSADRFDVDARRSSNLVCLHAAGASPSKGTSAVVQAWCRHREWPRLIVIRSPSWYSGKTVPEEQSAPNIEYVTERLDDKTWRKYQNECEIHVSPSEAEGFGHIIVEGMSCGAVVITTDGPPMNELVAAERGVLVRAARSEPMRLGVSYFVDVDELERQVGCVLRMEQTERRSLGRNARNWYETQTEAFEQAMRNLIDEDWPKQVARKSFKRT